MKSDAFYIKWIKATLIRCLRTFAFTIVGLLPTSTVINDIDWKFIFTSSAVSVLACLFTCIAGIPETDDEREIKEVMEENDVSSTEQLEAI